MEPNREYATGLRYGRRDGRYYRLVGRVPFQNVVPTLASARHPRRPDTREARAFRLGYLRGFRAVEDY